MWAETPRRRLLGIHNAHFRQPTPLQRKSASLARAAMLSQNKRWWVPSFVLGRPHTATARFTRILSKGIRQTLPGFPSRVLISGDVDLHCRAAPPVISRLALSKSMGLASLVLLARKKASRACRSLAVVELPGATFAGIFESLLRSCVSMLNLVIARRFPRRTDEYIRLLPKKDANSAQ